MLKREKWTQKNGVLHPTNALCCKVQGLGVPSSLPAQAAPFSSAHIAHTPPSWGPKGFGLQDLPPNQWLRGNEKNKRFDLLILSFYFNNSIHQTTSNLAKATTQETKEHIPEERIPDIGHNPIYQSKKWPPKNFPKRFLLLPKTFLTSTPSL